MLLTDDKSKCGEYQKIIVSRDTGNKREHRAINSNGKHKVRQYKLDGDIVYTSKELEEAIINIDETEKESRAMRHRFQDKFLQYECANSSEKIFDEVMKNERESLLSRILSKIFP